MSSVISSVFKKLKNIICLINEGDGGNDLVEDKRGKKHANMKFDFISNAANIDKFDADKDFDSNSNNKLMQYV